MTWRDLLLPEYVFTFIRMFLLAFLPVLGIASGVGNGGAIQIHAWPSTPSLVGSALLGILSGLQAVMALRAPTPSTAPPVAK